MLTAVTLLPWTGEGARAAHALSDRDERTTDEQSAQEVVMPSEGALVARIGGNGGEGGGKMQVSNVSWLGMPPWRPHAAPAGAGGSCP